MKLLFKLFRTCIHMYLFDEVIWLELNSLDHPVPEVMTSSYAGVDHHSSSCGRGARNQD